MTYFDRPTSFFIPSQRVDDIGVYITKHTKRYFNKHPGKIIFVCREPGKEIREVRTFNPRLAWGLIYKNWGTGASFSSVCVPSGLGSGGLE